MQPGSHSAGKECPGLEGGHVPSLGLSVLSSQPVPWVPASEYPRGASAQPLCGHTVFTAGALLPPLTPAVSSTQRSEWPVGVHSRPCHMASTLSSCSPNLHCGLCGPQGLSSGSWPRHPPQGLPTPLTPPQDSLFPGRAEHHPRVFAPAVPPKLWGTSCLLTRLRSRQRTPSPPPWPGVGEMPECAQCSGNPLSGFSAPDAASPGRWLGYGSKDELTLEIWRFWEPAFSSPLLPPPLLPSFLFPFLAASSSPSFPFFFS